MKGSSLRPCRTASLCITISVSCAPISGMASRMQVGRLNRLAPHVPGRVCAPPHPRRERELPLAGTADEALPHPDEPLDRRVALRRLVAVTPQVRLPHPRL